MVQLNYDEMFILLSTDKSHIGKTNISEIDEKISEIDAKISEIDAKISAIIASLNDEKISAIDEKISALIASLNNEKLSAIDAKISAIEGQQSEIEGQQSAQEKQLSPIVKAANMYMSTIVGDNTSSNKPSPQHQIKVDKPQPIINLVKSLSEIEEKILALEQFLKTESSEDSSVKSMLEILSLKLDSLKRRKQIIILHNQLFLVIDKIYVKLPYSYKTEHMDEPVGGKRHTRKQSKRSRKHRRRKHRTNKRKSRRHH
jgi:hypothetical protein